MQSAVERYFDWEERTRGLCASGVDANAWIDEIYFRARESALFDAGAAETTELIRRMRPRREYWNARPEQIPDRARAWGTELADGIRAAVEACDRLGLVRHLCWLIHSTLPIAREGRAPTPQLEEVAGEGLRALAGIAREGAASYRIEERYESSAGFLRRKGRKLFGNIYRIERPGQRPRYAELVETWQWEPSERLTLCVPIAIGCPNSCPMCEFGRYYGGELSAREILHLCELNLAADRDVPIASTPEDITIYYLGGGDACLYPEVPELLGSIAARWPGVQQVLSTIAVERGDSLARLVDAASSRSRVGLQISLCSLDEQVRSLCVGGIGVVPMSRAAEELHRFHRQSGRKGFVSLFLLPERYDDPDRIAAEAEALLDPAAIHITLTVMRENSLPFTRRRADESRFDAVASRLRALGFEVSISTNDADPDNEVSCGRSQIARELTGAFLKKPW